MASRNYIIYDDYDKYYDSSYVVSLQSKLKQSEEERMKLEKKLNNLQHRFKTEDDLRKQIGLRESYNLLIQQEKMRSHRNEDLKDILEKIENEACFLTAKTDRLRLLRHNYESYMEHLYPGWRAGEEEFYANYTRKLDAISMGQNHVIDDSDDNYLRNDIKITPVRDRENTVLNDRLISRRNTDSQTDLSHLNNFMNPVQKNIVQNNKVFDTPALPLNNFSQNNTSGFKPMITTDIKDTSSLSLIPLTNSYQSKFLPDVTPILSSSYLSTKKENIIDLDKDENTKNSFVNNSTHNFSPSLGEKSYEYDNYRKPNILINNKKFSYDSFPRKYVPQSRITPKYTTPRNLTRSSSLDTFSLKYLQNKYKPANKYLTRARSLSNDRIPNVRPTLYRSSSFGQITPDRKLSSYLLPKKIEPLKYDDHVEGLYKKYVINSNHYYDDEDDNDCSSTYNKFYEPRSSISSTSSFSYKRSISPNYTNYYSGNRVGSIDTFRYNTNITERNNEPYSIMNSYIKKPYPTITRSFSISSLDDLDYLSKKERYNNYSRNNYPSYYGNTYDSYNDYTRNPSISYSTNPYSYSPYMRNTQQNSKSDKSTITDENMLNEKRKPTLRVHYADELDDVNDYKPSSYSRNSLNINNSPTYDSSLSDLDTLENNKYKTKPYGISRNDDFSSSIDYTKLYPDNQNDLHTVEERTEEDTSLDNSEQQWENKIDHLKELMSYEPKDQKEDSYHQDKKKYDYPRRKSIVDKGRDISEEMTANLNNSIDEINKNLSDQFRMPYNGISEEEKNDQEKDYDRNANQKPDLNLKEEIENFNKKRNQPTRQINVTDQEHEYSYNSKDERQDDLISKSNEMIEQRISDEDSSKDIDKNNLFTSSKKEESPRLDIQRDNGNNQGDYHSSEFQRNIQETKDREVEEISGKEYNKSDAIPSEFDYSESDKLKNEEKDKDKPTNKFNDRVTELNEQAPQTPKEVEEIKKLSDENLEDSFKIVTDNLIKEEISPTFISEMSEQEKLQTNEKKQEDLPNVTNIQQPNLPPKQVDFYPKKEEEQVPHQKQQYQTDNKILQPVAGKNSDMELAQQYHDEPHYNKQDPQHYPDSEHQQHPPEKSQQDYIQKDSPAIDHNEQSQLNDEPQKVETIQTPVQEPMKQQAGYVDQPEVYSQVKPDITTPPHAQQNVVPAEGVDNYIPQPQEQPPLQDYNAQQLLEQEQLQQRQQQPGYDNYDPNQGFNQYNNEQNVVKDDPNYPQYYEGDQFQTTDDRNQPYNPEQQYSGDQYPTTGEGNPPYHHDQQFSGDQYERTDEVKPPQYSPEQQYAGDHYPVGEATSQYRPDQEYPSDQYQRTGEGNPPYNPEQPEQYAGEQYPITDERNPQYLPDQQYTGDQYSAGDGNPPYHPDQQYAGEQYPTTGEGDLQYLPDQQYPADQYKRTGEGNPPYNPDQQYANDRYPPTDEGNPQYLPDQQYAGDQYPAGDGSQQYNPEQQYVGDQYPTAEGNPPYNPDQQYAGDQYQAGEGNQQYPEQQYSGDQYQPTGTGNPPYDPNPQYTDNQYPTAENPTYNPEQQYTDYPQDQSGQQYQDQNYYDQYQGYPNQNPEELPQQSGQYTDPQQVYGDTNYDYQNTQPDTAVGMEQYPVQPEQIPQEIVKDQQNKTDKPSVEKSGSSVTTNKSDTELNQKQVKEKINEPETKKPTPGNSPSSGSPSNKSAEKSIKEQEKPNSTLTKEPEKQKNISPAKKTADKPNTPAKSPKKSDEKANTPDKNKAEKSKSDKTKSSDKGKS